MPIKNHKPKLNPRQLKFVKEYLKTGNGTQSAIAAGYAKKTARQISAQLLTNVVVSAEVDKHRAKVSQETGDTVERIIRELQEHREMAVEIKDLGAANKATELRGKHLRMFADQHTIEVGPSLLDMLLGDEE